MIAQEVEDLKTILENTECNCIRNARTYTEQKVRFNNVLNYVERMPKYIEEKYKAGYKEGYLKAIDELTEALRQECLDSIYKEVHIRDILKISMQLRGGIK